MAGFQPVEGLRHALAATLDFSQDGKAVTGGDDGIARLHPVAEDGIFGQQLTGHAEILRALAGKTENHGKRRHGPIHVSENVGNATLLHTLLAMPARAMGR